MHVAFPPAEIGQEKQAAPLSPAASSVSAWAVHSVQLAARIISPRAVEMLITAHFIP